MKQLFLSLSLLWLVSSTLVFADTLEIQHWLEMSDACEAVIRDQTSSRLGMTSKTIARAEIECDKNHRL